MAYGTPAGVAAYARQWTRGGTFYNAQVSPAVAPTKPTLTQVTNWIDQISSMFNVSLSNEGFAVPVSASDSLKSLTLKVETLVADLCAFANGTGRLYTDRVLERGSMLLVQKEIGEWVKSNATGLENDGVPRTQPAASHAGGFSVSPNRQG